MPRPIVHLRTEVTMTGRLRHELARKPLPPNPFQGGRTIVLRNQGIKGIRGEIIQGIKGDQAGSEASVGVTTSRSLEPVMSIE
jgi:hypothetical protein